MRRKTQAAALGVRAGSRMTPFTRPMAKADADHVLGAARYCGARRRDRELHHCALGQKAPSLCALLHHATQHHRFWSDCRPCINFQLVSIWTMASGMGTAHNSPHPFDGVQDRSWPIFRSLAAYRFAFLPQDLVAGLTSRPLPSQSKWQPRASRACHRKSACSDF